MLVDLIPLKIKEIIFSDEFNDMDKWSMENNNCDWSIDGGNLKTQSTLFYKEEELVCALIANQAIEAETGTNLVVEIRLRYELEWEHDYFSVNYYNNDIKTELKRFVNENL